MEIKRRREKERKEELERKTENKKKRKHNEYNQINESTVKYIRQKETEMKLYIVQKRESAKEEKAKKNYFLKFGTWKRDIL